MNNRITRRIALVMAILILNQAIAPTFLMALTSGPTQPEVQGFQPIGTSDMVNMFTGDFSYNIPLGEVDGYPLNLAYQADPNMEQEASWAGLGWSLNPGVINREVRGFPDDFRDEAVEKEFNLKDNITIGGAMSIGTPELFGLNFLNFSASFGGYYNSYRGYGATVNFGPTVAINSINSSIGLGLGYDTGGGLDFSISPQVGIGISRQNGIVERSLNFSTGFNSRQGLKSFSFGTKASHKEVSVNTYKTPLGAISLPTIGKITNGAASGSVSFGGFSYAPTNRLPIINESSTLNVSLGPTLFGGSFYASRKGYKTRQFLATNNETQSAYGYLFHGEIVKSNSTALMDYNKGAGIIHRESPVIPQSFGTYDLFNVSGQGVGGQYRAMRLDMGILRPGLSSNTGSALALGVEVSGGNLFDIGGNVTPTNSNSRKGAWIDQNRMAQTLEFENNSQTTEAVFFGTPGGNPHVANEAGLIQSLGSDLPMRAGITADYWTGPVRALSSFTSIDYDDEGQRVIDEEPITTSTNFLPEKRHKRNQNFNYLTSVEAAAVGLDKLILNKGIDGDLARTTHPDHHLSEVTITQPDGRRYIYGVPAYNKLQEEVSFSVSPVTIQTDAPATISYDEGVDNSTGNLKGREHFYDKTTTPEYAHSYLLTAILSPDYVDKTGDGISDDDAGYAVKLNYKRVHENFAWRTPFANASFQEGLKSDTKDDKANYIYGEKEVWYLHSVEGATTTAVFHTSPRKDGLGVTDTNGGLNEDKQLEKLDRIEIYSKSELLNDDDAVPIKQIHFEYDYTSCEGILNFSNNIPGEDYEVGAGKLTLKKVYFTYQDSERGKLNAYKFDYRQDDGEGSDFNYNMTNVNRWGLYQENPSDKPATNIYPYVNQDEDAASRQVAAWNLNEITLPSGGTIQVDYEPDDYAYVQDVRAGQMFDIKGFTNTTDGTGTTSNLLYNNADDINQYLVVENIDAETPEEALIKYLEDVEQLYFRCLVDLDNNGNSEYVSGYLEYQKEGAVFDGENGLLYIPLETVSAENIDNVHPISFAGIQMIRLERPALAYPGYEIDTDESIENIGVEAVLGFFREFGNVFKGFVRNGVEDSWSQQVDLTRSWVRLSNPTFSKIGGGSRVSQITISDEWNVSNSVGPSIYGQKYTYEKEVEISGVKEMISSGVAAYEPRAGGEENLMKNALEFDEKRALAPNNSYYVETPLGESLYPSPIVGYSKVSVHNLDYENVKGIGHTEHEFFTAREFPIIEKLTDLKKLRQAPNPLLSILKLKHTDKMTMSQGLMVEVNDMHGKPKSMKVFNAYGGLLESTTYSYKVDYQESDTAPEEESQQELQQYHLNNEVSLITPSGDIVDGIIGKSVEVWHEMEQDESTSVTEGVALNAIGILWAIIPSLGPFPHPTYSKEEIGLQTSTTTKFIQRFGILDQVTVMKNGSTLTTKNMFYDSETGAVLLTETQNEFNDKMYSFSYPAHWAYEDMGLAYQNIGAVVDVDPTNIDFEETRFKIPTEVMPFFHPGDEVLITSGEDEERLWVIENQVNNEEDEVEYMLFNIDGVPYATENIATGETLSIKIIRSGFRNQANTPIAAINSKHNPFVIGELTIDDETDVIDASAITLSEDWHMECDEVIDEPGTVMHDVNNVVNPYVQGLQGNWRPEKSYVYYGNRKNVDLNAPLDQTSSSTTIRETGVLTDGFIPFWTYNSTHNQFVPSTDLEKWTFTNRITLFDSRGNELENQDALGIKSAAQFGYNENLAIAVASNAAVKEMYFDGFEDYSYTNNINVEEAPFRKLVISDDMLIGDATITDLAAHSGNYSVEIDPNDTLNLRIEPGCLTVIDTGDGPVNGFYPVAVIEFPANTPSTISCGTQITFEGNNSYDPDEDGEIVNYEWLVTGPQPNNTVSASGNDLVSFNHIFNQVGFYSVQLLVTDNDDLVDVETINFTVVGDCPMMLLANGSAKSLDQGIDGCVTATFDSRPNVERYKNTCCSCLPSLEPQRGKTYLISTWVATDNSLECGTAPNDVSIVVSMEGRHLPIDDVSIIPSGPVIEGWQRYEGEFYIPFNMQYTEINFANNGSGSLFIDDFRIHPFNSNMQSYVYDDASLRLWATLDENNYATFYEYDDEGLLVRVKRETERGIMTVQESRTTLTANNQN